MNFYDAQLANEFLGKKIIASHPFFISRLGFSELDHISKIYGGPRLIPPINRLKAAVKAPYTQLKRKFFLESIGPEIELAYKNADMHFYESDPRIIGAEHYVNVNIPSRRIMLPQEIILPIRLNNPWVKFLCGKKVLVISPFVDDFERQFARLNLIWAKKKEMAPNFGLLKYKSPFYFHEWQPALQRLKEDIALIDFEIALIGAGPISSILGFYISSVLRRQSINVGGALQLYFGVIGQRWIDSGIVDNYLNDSWIRPTHAPLPNYGARGDNINYW